MSGSRQAAGKSSNGSHRNVLWAISAVASDLRGTWSGTFKVNGEDHTIPQMMIFQTGWDQAERVCRPGCTGTISDREWQGRRRPFEVRGHEWRFSYDLTRSGQDEINGNLDLKSVNNGRTAVVSLNRVK